MLLIDALNQIIDDGLEEVRLVYSRPDQRLKREGATRGFEDCRGLSPKQIGDLLAAANARTRHAFDEQAPDYWFWRFRAAQITWVANVISAILMNQGAEVIIPPTARGGMKAAEIIGIGTR